ncbi:MAG: acyl-CoA dehydrogenase family protein [Candidatus Marinimicrobia bacterium]|nr:acyl-CoA dehydrogenase family protein [Candidatus Neomarinimicrobiota bacterium]MBL7067328.1 acyl-CoA dehydrogenase family protein [Candidatus Neomarinimicrobiota bacterium]
MANYYNDNRKFYFEKTELQDIVSKLENNFQDNGSEALHSYDEALKWYDMVLKNAGDICANFIAPRAEAVDEQGPTYRTGIVEWAPETRENMETLTRSGYMGGMLPRKYGGLNLPVTVNTIIVEMVSQADASLMNLFGLQDIAVTINKFGSEEQKDRVLPKFCSGEVSGSMALTEPDAGSDLQAVALRAIEKDGEWYLDGVKRFITNGSGEVSLVLARSEEGSKGGRGLSMFLYERYRDDNMIVRRIENKHGIHGSPTCEMQFNMAKAELVGRRKFGLIKYVMSLMNGARLAVSSQALGIAQAAYEEAVKYANEREQFGKTIVHFPAVYQMLKKMQAEIETTRMLLYRTALFVDYEDMYERKAGKGENVKAELKYAAAMADFLTPLAKFTATEMANKVAYDAVQIHGGCGYMKDFPVERLARDARITNIYEGTTQLQVVAAIGGVSTNVLEKEWEALRNLEVKNLDGEKEIILGYVEQLQQTANAVLELKNKDFYDYVANYLVEIASIIYRCALFLPVAEEYEGKRELFRYYMNESATRIDYLMKEIRSLKDHYGESIADLKADFVIK